MAEDKATPLQNSHVSKRNKLIMIALSTFIMLGILALAYWTIFLQYKESTDDAYVMGNVVQITPQVAGTIITITADDTDFVKAGSTLVLLDSTDAKLGFDRARAQLAQTVRQTRHLVISTTELRANLALNKVALDKAKLDLARRYQLLKTDSITPEELDHTRLAVTSAQAAYKIALEKLKGNQALWLEPELAKHPAILATAASVREAYLALKRTKIVSPINGYLARRAAQIGQRVNIGQNLLSVVSLDDVWVEANFKEAQLAHIRIGQAVKLTADLYGGQVTYHGKVAGLSVGTGSAFALLPAQNATGNWIKVVQRVPVRIALNKSDLKKHPLRIGLSMTVEVDTQDQNGPVLALTERQKPLYSTDVFKEDMKAADNIVTQIILQNAN